MVMISATLTYKGAHRRYGEVLDEKVEERLKYELKTIEWMGFPGYFLGSFPALKVFLSVRIDRIVHIGFYLQDSAGKADIFSRIGGFVFNINTS